MRSADSRGHAEAMETKLQELELIYSQDSSPLFFPAWLLPLRLEAIKELKHVLGSRGEGYDLAITTLEIMLAHHDTTFLLECYSLFKALLKSVAEVQQEAPELKEALQEAVFYNEPDGYGRALKELLSYSQAVVTSEREEEVYGLLSQLEAKALLRGYRLESVIR